LPGVVLRNPTISPDGKTVAYGAGDGEIWLAPLDRRSPPRKMVSGGARRPSIGASGNIYFEASEGGQNYLYRMNSDGTAQRRALPNPIIAVRAISPDERWVIATVAAGRELAQLLTQAMPLDGGKPVLICGRCFPTWTTDGTAVYMSMQPEMGGEGV